MSANTWGQNFCVHSFGESHGAAMGVVVDGCPAGVVFDEEKLLWLLSRRRPGHSTVTSSRKEEDLPEILSGVFEGKTLGTPISMMVRNKDQRSEDYSSLNDRAGHGDDVWREKFGHVDPRGGGRSSGRETVSRVMAGAVAEMLVSSLQEDVRVYGYAHQIANFSLPEDFDFKSISSSGQDPRLRLDSFPSRLPDKEVSDSVTSLLTTARQEGRSYGGEAHLVIEGLPIGLGQPVFHKLKSDLAAAVMSVGATCSFELGDARRAVTSEGSEFHSHQDDGSRYGGIRAGLSTGEDILLKVGFKPTSSVLDVAKKGRHDPCIIPRAIPVLEAMIWLVLADHLLWQRLCRLYEK